MENPGTVIISGSRGWFGRVFSNIIETQFPDLKLIKLSNSGENNFWTYSSFENVIGFVHLAFLTKEKQKELGDDYYLSTNRAITKRASEIVKLSQPKWVVTISSGAASQPEKHLLYGYLKLEEELNLLSACETSGSNLAVGRLWGATGIEMPINRNYAISDFIFQALEHGKINITSKGKVWRRYCDASEFANFLLSQAATEKYWIGDSGGILTEIGDLAKEVSLRLGISEISRPPIVEKSDDYYSDSCVYSELTGKYGKFGLSLAEQVNQTIRGHLLQTPLSRYSNRFLD